MHELQILLVEERQEKQERRICYFCLLAKGGISGWCIDEAFIRQSDVPYLQDLMPCLPMAAKKREFLIVARGTVPLNAFQQCNELGDPTVAAGVFPVLPEGIHTFLASSQVGGSGSQAGGSGSAAAEGQAASASSQEGGAGGSTAAEEARRSQEPCVLLATCNLTVCLARLSLGLLLLFGTCRVHSVDVSVIQVC